MKKAIKASDSEGRPLRAFIYCRTSSDDGKKDDDNDPNVSRKESTAVQAEECRDLCKRNGYTIVPASKETDAFEEKDFSGRTYPSGFDQTDPAFEHYFKTHIHKESKHSRPKFGQLLSRISEVDLIVCRDFTRLIRPARHSHLGNFLLQFMSANGIQVHSIADGRMDPDNFANMLTTNLQMMITDDAKMTELEKSVEVLKRKKDNGWLTGGANFYGFQSSGHQKMSPVPEQLEIVRHIFNRFLEGAAINEITRELNDQHNTRTTKDRIWTSRPVRNILCRPAYAGLARNSAGRLIESKVFNPHAIISESDYLAVVRQLKTEDDFMVLTDHAKDKRTERAQTLGHKRGGRPLGSTNSKGPCHPLSGLMRCGRCGRHLYVVRVINPFYDKPVPVYYYQCHSHLFSKSAEYDDCRKVRLLESYPQEAADQTKHPTGHGLLESLFPILFVAYIKKYTTEVRTDKGLEKDRLALEQKIAELQQEERTLTNQFLPALSKGDADAKEQFDNIMADRRVEMKQLNEKRLASLERKTDADLGEVVLPEDYFSNPALISRETLRALAHLLIDTISVFPDKIEVVFNDGDTMKIERVKNRNSRLLPFWRAVVNTAKITAKSKLTVTYFYKSTQAGNMMPVVTLIKAPNLEVLSVGNNNSVDFKRAKVLRDPALFARLLEPLVNVRPTHKRELHFSSAAFFPGSVGEETIFQINKKGS
jgi:DNA invertase Pin-like site-specific DNA recombinase